MHNDGLLDITKFLWNDIWWSQNADKHLHCQAHLWEKKLKSLSHMLANRIFSFFLSIAAHNLFLNNTVDYNCQNNFSSEICIYPVSKKTGHLILAHNFGKCWPIFKILSLSDSAVIM